MNAAATMMLVTTLLVVALGLLLYQASQAVGRATSRTTDFMQL